MCDAAPGFLDNPFLPDLATVVETVQETPAIKTLRVRLDNAARMASFSFQPGQVAQLSLFGAGESTFVINSPPTRTEYLQFSIMRAGEVTAALHGLRPGDKVGIRAPLGNWFPHERMRGKDIFFIGGGIGMAPLRTLLLYMLDNRADFGSMDLLYGARTPEDMAFREDVAEWLERDDLRTTLTVDQAPEDWPHRSGLIPTILTELAPSGNGMAVLCGPPIMIKFTVQALKKLGFADENIITTLERRMKCGIGLCGRCNIGTKYVCVDGPVFSYAELRELPNEL
ncbi:MAG: FAD/NAD(P)-binding protein [Desulfovibrionaceae bacterium]